MSRTIYVREPWNKEGSGPDNDVFVYDLEVMAEIMGYSIEVAEAALTSATLKRGGAILTKEECETLIKDECDE